MISTPRTSHHAFTSALVALLLTVAGGWSAPTRAAAVDLSKTPPDLTKSVDPNIVLSFDDSGSMLATAMPDAVSDSGHFDTKHYYSVTTNVIYFDPNKTYVPPLKPDGSSFPDSTYTNAWRDGMCANWPGTYCYGSANHVDLSDHFSEDFLNITSSSNTANTYSNSQECIPDSISDSECDGDGSGGGGGFYYTCPTVHSDTACVKVEINGESSAVKQNFANWYSYYRTRNLMTRTSVSRAFATMGDNIRVAWQTINDIPLTASDEIKALAGTTTGSWRHDFFTFLYDVHTAGSTPDRRATLRAAKFFERALTQNDLDPYWNGLSGADSADLSCRQNFHMLVTDGYWNWSSDPDPGTGTNDYPSGMQTSEDDLTFDSDQSYTYVLDDGTEEQRIPPAFSTTDSTSQIFWNVEGSEYTSSLANIAFHYWATDLQPNLDNEVPTYLPDLSTGVTGPDDSYTQGDDPLQNPEIYWNPVNDPATWQHVVQFMVTLGVAGERAWPDDLNALRTGALDWPRPENNQPEAVDDTWHAAINSRGQYFSASDPNALVSSLTAILYSVAARSNSSTAGSLNTGVVTTDTNGFFSGYDSGDWSGSLTAREVELDGGIGDILWDAGCILTGGHCVITSEDAGTAVDPTTRNIFTSTAIGADNGVTFVWANLIGAQQDLLNSSPVDGTDDGQGELRLEFLRGDRSQESASPGFHRRGSVLGAVVNSQPTFVSYPSSGYRDDFPAGSPEAVAAASGDTYEKFAYDHRLRTPTVYVGANDGMLHAFDAVNGDELFAYVPAAVYPRLSSLTAVDYIHTPTVDNSAVTKDVFFDSDDKWHTMLIGSLRYGGRGVFALDITDPTTFVATDVLWEFTYQSTGGANLGYTYGTPNIGRLANGKWVVLVPGGYFPEDSTDPHYGDPAASNTFSSLFVLDAETGALIRELKTPTGVNSWGLSTPVLGDYQDDQIDDVAFAGDIVGNLWRFDLTSASPASWTVDQVFDPAVELTQPITVMPRLFPDPVTNQFIVVFGTGKYLGLDDRTNTGPTQAIYGIREYGPGATVYPVQVDDLREQDLTEDSGIRLLTDAAVPAANRGWFFDLDTAAGERMVVPATALFNTNRAVIATLIPGGNDPCNPARKGAILVVDAATGGPGGGLDALGAHITVPDGSGVAGARVDNPPATGVLPTATVVGGGRVVIPGITLPDGTTFGLGDAFWRRRSWRVLD